MPKRAPSKRKMPAFTKPTAATVKSFETATSSLAGVERRTMFGYPAIFLNGNMLASIFQDRIMVRLSPSDRAEAIDMHAARLFEPSPGRAMKEYVELPTSIVADDRALRAWLERGRTFVATLPTKKPRRSKA